MRSLSLSLSIYIYILTVNTAEIQMGIFPTYQNHLNYRKKVSAIIYSIRYSFYIFGLSYLD